MNEYFGIDFGTTNSATVRIEFEHTVRYADDQGLPYPSIIAIDRMTGQIKSHGRAAWRQREQLRKSCEIITSVKTHLGTDKTWIIGNKSWSPRQVTAEILKGLKEGVAERGDGIDLP